jgi:hypothetical protein
LSAINRHEAAEKFSMYSNGIRAEIESDLVC